MDHISIKDFASRAGVSPQAIYQRLDKDLQGYVKVIKGKKTLDIKALDLFVDKQVGQAVDKSFQDILTVLSNQLIEKDKQIAELTATIKIQAQSINAERHNELAGTIQKQQLVAAAPDEKPGLWQRIFGRKKDDQ